MKYLDKTELLDHLRDFEEALNKKIEELSKPKETEYYWTARYEDITYDLEESGVGAYNYANETFQQDCVDDDETQCAMREIYLIKFHYNDDGEKVIDCEEKHHLYFEREE